MIIKEKNAAATSDTLKNFGDKQEASVSFHLERAFGREPDVLVLNDLRLVRGSDVAQIDHLVIYPHGFVIIESKSIYGEVRINAEGEWSRSFQGKWQGMPSPIQQAKLQGELLRDLLNDHAPQLLPRIFGIPSLQHRFGGREWSFLCAVSSSAILHRESMPADVAESVAKSEFIAAKVQAIIKAKGAGLLSTSTRIRFAQKDLEGIGTFLLGRHTPSGGQKTQEPQRETVTDLDAARIEPVAGNEPDTGAVANQGEVLCCKSCASSDFLSGHYGRFGYYVRCSKCETNTSMKAPCAKCHSSSVKVVKKQRIYRACCGNCGHDRVVYEETSVRA